MAKLSPQIKVGDQAPNVLQTPAMASISRTIFATAGACILALLAGCVMHETYSDHSVPERELAVVEGYWRYQFLYDEELHIVSLDGKREGGKSGWPYAYSVSLPPGKHWLQFAILRNSNEIAMCAFDWTFEAQHRYKLRRLNHGQFLLAHPASSLFAASVSIEVTAPAKPVQNLSAPTVCGKGPMCRQNTDCSLNHSCQLDASFDFGTCKLRDR
jgi:hypothetical protein